MTLFIGNPYKKKNVFCFFIVTGLFISSVLAQERKYSVSNAHAHNDYNHPLPFRTAYGAGFGSIEADIILKNNELYVAHSAVEITPERTLQALYLNPLKEVIQKNKGYAYKDSVKSLLLLIDLKTAVEPTLDKLIEVLQKYKEIRSCPTLKIVITGNQPDVLQLTSYPHYIYFDGNFKLNYTAEVLNKVALFSDNFCSYTKWNGEDAPSETDKNKIENAVTKAHALHKPIRFWAAPDLPNAWHFLMRLQVDYINTDKISEISTFLHKFSTN